MLDRVLDVMETKETGPMVLPSAHQLGDRVKVFIMPEGEESFPGFPAKVRAVHFTPAKVKYDLEILLVGGYSTRIYNVDSVLVLKA